MARSMPKSLEEMALDTTVLSKSNCRGIVTTLVPPKDSATERQLTHAAPLVNQGRAVHITAHDFFRAKGAGGAR